jgi:hypothetical protein
MKSPFEYHNEKLGVLFSFLTTDKNPSQYSLNLITYRSLKKRCDSSTSTEIQLRAGSYSSKALISFDSLTESWRDLLVSKFGEPKKEIQKSWFESHYEADKKAFDFYQAYTYSEAKRLSIDLVELYTLQASTLNTVLKVKANRSAYRKAIGSKSINIWESLSRDVNNFRSVNHKLPTHKNSLRKKVKDFQENGYEGIISKKIQNSNASKTSEKEQQAIIDELIAKHTNLDSEIIATIYNAIAEQSGWKSITRQTVANRKKETNLITFAGRNGTKALKSKLLMQHKRSAPSCGMLYWTLDGWDSELLYQRKVNDAKGHSKTTYHNRLTIVLVLDPFNKYPIGYAIGENESPALIRKALQNAVNHTKELFGSFFKPYQLQSDNYAIKNLRPIYEGMTNVFTPASVGNAKAKVIEPYFGYINKKYCKLFDNWSGFNVDSGSKSQPNDEMLNKLRHSFPDKQGAMRQLERIIDLERNTKQAAFVESFKNVPSEYVSEMTHEQYLFLFGDQSSKTIKMRPEGLRMRIDGVARFYDSFDMNFRKMTDKSWQICFDESNMEKILAVSDCGSFRFLLEEKHVEPMAIADRNFVDNYKGSKINEFNKKTIDLIQSTRQENAETTDLFFSKNQHLNDTLAKHLLTDSRGQHKEPKQVLKTAPEARTEEVLLPTVELIQKTTEQSAQDYYKEKLNLSKYTTD